MTTIKELKSDKLKFKSEPGKYAEIANLLGHKYQELGRYDEAVEEHQEAIGASKRIKNTTVSRQTEAISHRALGECFSDIGKHAEAKKEHDAYLSLAQSLGEQIEIQRAHATMGRTYLHWAGDTAPGRNQRDLLFKAAKSFRKALELCESLKSSGKLKNREYDEMKARLLLNLGLVYDSLAEFDKCKKLLFDAIEITKNNFLYEDLFRCQIALAGIYEKSKDFAEEKNALTMAKASYEDSLETAKKLNSKTKRFDAFICLALISAKLENIEKARGYFKKAYSIKTPVEEDKAKAARLLKITSVIRDDLLKIPKCETASEQLISLYDRLGDHFVELKCYSLAVKYYKLELAQAKLVGKADSFIANIYVSIGQTYGDDRQYREAIECFTEEYRLQQSRAEQCASLLKIAELQEALLEETDDLELETKDVIKADIRESYEKALRLFDDGRIFGENASPSMSSKETRVHVQAMKNFAQYLVAHKLDAEKQKALKQQLQEHYSSKVDRNNCTIELSDDEKEEEEEDADVPDIYDQYNLDLISDPSEVEASDDEELPGNTSLVGKKRNPNAAKLNRLNQFGETPLHTACIAGNIAAVERLIEQKAPLNAKDYCGWTPLHESCNHGHVEIVECLLKAGAFVDSADDRSERLTPLHDACDNGHIGIARLLLKYDANVCALNVRKETPVERLISWRNRTELNEKEMEQCVLLEKELMSKMADEGFNLDALHRKMADKRDSGNGSSQSRSSRSQSQLDPRIKRHRNLTGGEIYLEKSSMSRPDSNQTSLDDPSKARSEYQSAMDKLRRVNSHIPPRLAKLATRNDRTLEKAALVEESEVAPRDDWLIDDLGAAGKSSTKRVYREERVTARYGPSPKKRRHSGEQRQSKQSKHQPLRRRFLDLDESSDLRLNHDDLSVGSHQNNFTTTIEPSFEAESDSDQFDSELGFDAQVRSVPEPVAERNRDLPRMSKVETSSEQDVVCRMVIVQFDDAQRSSFAIPLPPSTVASLTFKWLSAELCKRYFRKFSVKPVVSLYTTEGAIISDEDQLVDMIRGCTGKPTFRASIESYTMEEPAKRFKELCLEKDVETLSELVDALAALKMNGTFNVSNSFVGCKQQNQFMFQSLYRQEVKEINVSWSNILLERPSIDSFFSALSTLPTLQVLNLSGCAFPRKHLLHLLNLSPILRHLDLSFNTIGDEHAYAISQLINFYDKLRQLNLSACELSESFLKNSLLITAIEGASNLASIDFDYNDIQSNLVAKFKSLSTSKLFLKTLQSR